MRTINNLAGTLFALIALVGLTATSGLAQTSQGSNGSDVVLRIWDFLPASAQTHLDQGDSFIAEREYGKARKEYRTAEELIRAEGGFPSVAIRRIADAYYYEGEYTQSVSTLDRLAREAAEYGDVETLAWAQADAAWVLSWRCSQRECPGVHRELKEREYRMWRVFASPYLPDHVRSEIFRTRCRGCHGIVVSRGP